MRWIATTCAATLLLGGVVTASMPEPIDLAALNEVVASEDVGSSAGSGSFEPVSYDRVAADRRFYVSGMLGSSFATLADPVYANIDGSRINGTILTAGGAAGFAYARDNGQLRVEFEGRGRDDLTRSLSAPLPPPLAAQVGWAADDGWSTLLNVWRDVAVNDVVSVYAGGGVGAGGYRYSFDYRLSLGPQAIGFTGNKQVASFAWQAGGGVIWDVSDRMAFDVGYRFFAIDQANTTYFITVPPAALPVESLAQQFTASELVFSLRIYEPFRNWR